MNTLDHIEKQIRVLFESASTILPWADQNAIMVHKLCETIQSHYSDQENLNTLEPPEFVIQVHTSTYENWRHQNEWEGILVEAIMSTMRELGYQFNCPPQILTRIDDTIPPDDARIFILEKEKPLEKTSSVGINKAPDVVDQLISPVNHLLILKNEKIFYLDQPVINLGRKSTNQIILNDLRISRLHAQIRKVADGFMVFDVGSTGGTFVNGERINQHLLHPGDVISLAGYPIIYTEDQTGSSPLKNQSANGTTISRPTKADKR